MAKSLFTTFVFLFLAMLCRGQQTGCFTTNAQTGIEFESSINFSKYNAFFVGEFHGVYGVPEIKLALIKYLNQHYGITDVFMETSYSAAYLYNAYLATGDTSFLEHPLMIFYMKEPWKKFWKGLYEYNKTLEHKITIRGMDFERIEFLKTLKLLAPPGKKKPTEIAATLTFIDTVAVPELERIHTPGYESQYTIYAQIRADMEQHKQQYKQYYGSNSRIVSDIMFNKDTYRNYDNRNKTMYDNMARQIRENNIAKFVVFCGMNHGGKGYQGWKSLCYRLAENDAFKGKLADIAMVCKNCYDWQLQPQYRHADYRGPSSYNDDGTLIDSIFGKYFDNGCKYTLIPTEAVDDRRVQQFSDFIILMKDQPEF